MPSIGILAYGSLIEEPGPEIEADRVRVIPVVTTPFKIEFARKSSSRGGAPSLIPVQQGGAAVSANIIVLRDSVTEADASDMVWRRETRKIGSGKHYVAQTNPGPNVVVVKRIEKLGDIDVVLYTHIGVNIDPLTSQHLAELAIASVGQAEHGKDGISYLMAALQRGMTTPLSGAYTQEVLRLTGTASLSAALSKLRGTST